MSYSFALSRVILLYSFSYLFFLEINSDPGQVFLIAGKRDFGSFSGQTVITVNHQTYMMGGALAGLYMAQIIYKWLLKVIFIFHFRPVFQAAFRATFMYSNFRPFCTNQSGALLNHMVLVVTRKHIHQLVVVSSSSCPPQRINQEPRVTLNLLRHSKLQFPLNLMFSLFLLCKFNNFFLILS